MASQPQVSVLKEFVESSDQHRLFMRSHRPGSGIQAALAIVHGFHSHSAYYEAFASDLAVRGVAAYALDLRGQGRSSGTRFGIEHFARFCDDVSALMCTIREREPSSPIFLLGQGAGGLVACLYALTNPRQLNGVICSSIALELPLHPMFRSGIELLAAVAPRIPVLRVRSGSFSRDPGIVARMNDDPLINGERQRARMVSETLRAGDELRKSASELLQPLLVLHGSADTVTLPSGSEYMHEHAGSRDKTLQIFEGYHHDLINEQGHELVVEKICQWIDTQLHATAQRTLIGIEYINAGSSSGSP